MNKDLDIFKFFNTNISILNLFSIFFGIYLFLFLKDIYLNNHDNIKSKFINEISRGSGQIILVLITFFSVIVIEHGNGNLLNSLDDQHLTDNELNRKHLLGSLVFAILGLIIGFLGKIGIWGLNFFLIFVIYYYVNPNKFIKNF
jgi:uncharacterized membrane protein YbjE (DUF340 family)